MDVEISSKSISNAHAFRICVYSAVLLSDVKRSINKSVVELIGKTLA